MSTSMKNEFHTDSTQSLTKSLSLRHLEMELEQQESVVDLSTTQPMERETQWGNRWQFILSCIGFAVGLGNIWRFPFLAYENGGGAFLIPYLFCSLVIGFPFVYLEMALGQYSQSGPAVVHGRLRPIFQGLGWSMSVISLIIATYYNVIVGWVLIYLYTIITGNSWQWSSCRNEFNTEHCISISEDKNCAQFLGDINAFYFDKKCYFGNNSAAITAKNSLSFVSYSAEEFFERYVLERTETIDELGGINIKVVCGLAVAWIVTALVLFKGVKIMGYTSYFSATVPYIIIAIMFIRAVTLDGAITGLQFYLFQPDFSKIWEAKVWVDAASQVCFSLSIGIGGLLSLSSYSPRTHNVYRDALIIALADGFMSIFGGTAVFSVLGFMAKQLNKPIKEVIQGGTGLAFIAYPQATSLMPLSWLWALMFFTMLFLLGISSQFGLTEVLCTAIYDQFQSIRAHRGLFSFAICAILFLIGLIMCTRAGIYYFTIFNNYAVSYSMVIELMLELGLVVYIYGLRNFLDDLRSMFGHANNRLGRIFGPTGYYVQFIWCILAPMQSAVILVLLTYDQIVNSPKYKINGKEKQFPDWAIVMGWIIATIPMIMLPVWMYYNVLKFRRRGQSLRQLFRLQPKWPSYARIMNKEKMEINKKRIEGVKSAQVMPINNVAMISPIGWNSNKQQQEKMRV